MNAPREKWSALKLAHTGEQRARIMAFIQRLNAREGKAIDRAVLVMSGQTLPRPFLRAQIRSWYYSLWKQLLTEYEAMMPHVSELPDEVVARAVRKYIIDEDAARSRVEIGGQPSCISRRRSTRRGVSGLATKA